MFSLLFYMYVSMYVCIYLIDVLYRTVNLLLDQQRKPCVVILCVVSRVGRRPNQMLYVALPCILLSARAATLFCID